LLTLVILVSVVVALVVVCSKLREHNSRLSSLEQTEEQPSAKSKK